MWALRPRIVPALLNFKSMRHDDIRKKYTRHGGLWKDENKLFTVGEQMQYEWEQDFITMRWAIDYLINGGVSGKQLALDVLLKRVSEHSCPSNKKEQYKTKENCPLKDGCKCLHGVSLNGR